MIGWAHTAAQAEPARGSRSQPKGAEETRGGAKPARRDSHRRTGVGHPANVRAFIRTPLRGGWVGVWGVRIKCAAARHAAAWRIEQMSCFVMVAACQPLEQNSVHLVQFATPFRRTSIHIIGGNMMLRRIRAAAHHYYAAPMGGWVGIWVRHTTTRCSRHKCRKHQ